MRKHIGNNLRDLQLMRSSWGFDDNRARVMVTSCLDRLIREARNRPQQASAAVTGKDNPNLLDLPAPGPKT